MNKKQILRIALSFALISAASGAPQAFADDSGGGLTSFLNDLFSSPATAQKKSTPTFSAPANVSGSLSDLTSSGDFRVSSTMTSDSSVVLTGTLPAGTRTILIRVTQDGAKPVKDVYYADPGAFSRKVYLRQGPGHYQIGLFYSTDGSLTASHTSLAFFGVQNTDPRDMTYLVPTQDVQSDALEISEMALTITELQRTPMDQLLAVHDWVTRMVSYDAKSLYDGSFAAKRYDALSTFNTRLAVCQGYANLTAALLRSIGIPTKVVNGNVFGPGVPRIIGGTVTASGCAINHAWNEALIDGRWVVLDPTFDSGSIRGGQFVSSPKRDYFDNPAVFDANHIKCEDSTN